MQARVACTCGCLWRVHMHVVWWIEDVCSSLLLCDTGMESCVNTSYSTRHDFFMMNQ